MKLEKIEIKNFRNINNITLIPHENVNIIYGENAQGKTNIIEAIWLFSGLKSFRGATPKQMIKLDKENCELFANFYSKNRSQNAKILYSEKKEVFLNEVNILTESKLNSIFNCVVFSPIHLNIIKNSPDERRKFLNDALCQIKPVYKNYINKYEKALMQRNALLKKLDKKNKDSLEVWDITLSEIGTIIALYRNDYINKINEISTKIYRGISSERENMELKYFSNIFQKEDFSKDKNELVNIYFNKLLSSREKDILLGSTNLGVSRDDIEFEIDKLSAKIFASQGQQRSAVISLKLAEAYLLKLSSGEFPIILLDDVMSELDQKRQNYLINYIKDFQIFITGCHKRKIKNLEVGKEFKIKQGVII